MLEHRLADMVAEKTVAADAHESGRQHVPQERLAEGERGELGDLDAVSISAIAVVAEDVVTVVGDQALVADGDLAHVAGEVSNHLLGTTEGASDVDVPSPSRRIAETLVSGLVGNAGLPVPQESLKLREEFPLEDGLEDDEGDEVVAAVDKPPGAKPTAGHEAVKAVSRIVSETAAKSASRA